MEARLDSYAEADQARLQNGRRRGVTKGIVIYLKWRKGEELLLPSAFYVSIISIALRNDPIALRSICQTLSQRTSSKN